MDENPKSTSSIEVVAVRFINKSKRKVDVIWLDFEGLPVKYFTLEPDHYSDMTTYISHPWIFQDTETKDKLVANSQYIFYPPNWLEIFRKKYPDTPTPETPQRIIVWITIPVYTLRERCLQVVRDCLNFAEEYKTVDLQLPKSIEDDLIVMLLKKDGVYISDLC